MEVIDYVLFISVCVAIYTAPSAIANIVVFVIFKVPYFVQDVIRKIKSKIIKNKAHKEWAIGKKRGRITEDLYEFYTENK